MGLLGSRWGLILSVSLGASLALPGATDAQIIGTAYPYGSATLAGSDNKTASSKSGNPMTFDSTIQFQGLTAHGHASNGYTFLPQEVAVDGHETLSVSGALDPGYNNAFARLEVGAMLSGQRWDPHLPDGANYLYEIVGVRVTVKGVLAPGDSAFFDIEGKGLRSNGSPCTDLLTGQLTQYYFSKTFTNAGTDMMTISASHTFPAGFLGDWYYVRSTDNFPYTMTGGIQAYITKTKTSSPAESWIEIDPTYSIVARSTAVPEPNSLVLAGLGTLCMVAYTARRRFRPMRLNPGRSDQSPESDPCEG